MLHHLCRTGAPCRSVAGCPCAVLLRHQCSSGCLAEQLAQQVSVEAGILPKCHIQGPRDDNAYTFCSHPASAARACISEPLSNLVVD